METQITEVKPPELIVFLNAQKSAVACGECKHDIEIICIIM